MNAIADMAAQDQAHLHSIGANGHYTNPVADDEPTPLSTKFGTMIGFRWMLWLH